MSEAVRDSQIRDNGSFYTPKMQQDSKPQKTMSTDQWNEISRGTHRGQTKQLLSQVNRELVHGPDSYLPALHAQDPMEISDYYHKQRQIQDKPHESAHLIPVHIKSSQKF